MGIGWDGIDCRYIVSRDLRGEKLGNGSFLDGRWILESWVLGNFAAFVRNAL
jgi:hypothetical protein